MKIKYEKLRQDSKTNARHGKLYTNYGVVETPMFMPVGTQATVKKFTVVLFYLIPITYGYVQVKMLFIKLVVFTNS